VATASGSRPEDSPDPIEHATPDVELAEAQLAVGRPELADAEPVPDEPLADDDGGLEEAEDPDLVDGGGRELAAGRASTPAKAPRGLSRLVHFIQGSWRELQRVQWPDRRQVMQATGVVIGFVIVAGAFLGVADLVAQKVVNLIIK
jgi:preprotein translocase subunit SecE